MYGRIRHRVLSVKCVYVRKQYGAVAEIVWVSSCQSHPAAIHVLQSRAMSRSQ
jgi:hypothetical protein